MKTKKQSTILCLTVSLLCVVGKASEGKGSNQQDGKPWPSRASNLRNAQKIHQALDAGGGHDVKIESKLRLE